MQRKNFDTAPLALASETESGAGSSQVPEANKPGPIPKLLSISPEGADHETLREMLNGQCRIANVGTCREALSFLCQDRVPVIFCEADLLDGAWRDILSYTAGLTEPPALVVTSKLADEVLWAEVLNQGGFDVLAKPFNEREVKHVVAGALRQRASPAPRVMSAGATWF